MKNSMNVQEEDGIKNEFIHYRQFALRISTRAITAATFVVCYTDIDMIQTFSQNLITHSPLFPILFTE